MVVRVGVRHQTTVTIEVHYVFYYVPHVRRVSHVPLNLKNSFWRNFKPALIPDESSNGLSTQGESSCKKYGLLPTIWG